MDAPNLSFILQVCRRLERVPRTKKKIHFLSTPLENEAGTKLRLLTIEIER